jgi:hypothetical protein
MSCSGKRLILGLPDTLTQEEARVALLFWRLRWFLFDDFCRSRVR